MNRLESLKKYSKIVVDSGDMQSIQEYLPEDITTNPSLILKVITLPKYEYIINNSIAYSKKKGGTYHNQLINAVDKISVMLGQEILSIISGKISTEIDAHLSFNSDMCIEKSKKIISMYEEEGISRSKILIKLASTWECIKAAEELKKFNINCNLTLLFSFAQARACAEANVYLISPFVGRIYDWYKSKSLIQQEYSVDKDPGVCSVRKIYYYYKQYGYKTIIMGASFRNIHQILALSGCDYLTISPDLLKELKSSTGNVVRQLHCPKVMEQPIDLLSRSQFLWLHNEEPMAVEKLSEGIRQFGEDYRKLKQIIKAKM
ncbi:transaldolase [Buchnera aphidicola]|uniref:Transaldolase n=1 Tax=Buchnera aphidicola subsp. Melaphis rhois TaxID=118103 RepID=A0A4D6Y0R6_BUCMH|nr:transaldolase [Buchnera aphidicola]QCI23126.1 transaldolase [Buchnera aphidicola (Melaphis rhois)]